LKNQEQAVYQTMKDVTEAVKVGDATLIRFSQKIGFNGFSDLKIAIAKEEFTSQYEGDNDHQFYDRILENQIKVLESTRQLLDPEVVLQAIEAITKAKSDIHHRSWFEWLVGRFVGKDVAPGRGACEPYR
jgi:DNA-binding MurR/RpiR family transcriptional regulator